MNKDCLVCTQLMRSYKPLLPLTEAVALAAHVISCEWPRGFFNDSMLHDIEAIISKRGPTQSGLEAALEIAGLFKAGAVSSERIGEWQNIIHYQLARVKPDTEPPSEIQLRHKSSVSQLMGLAVKLRYAGGTNSANYDTAFKTLQDAIYAELSTPMTPAVGHFVQTADGYWRQCIEGIDRPLDAVPLYRHETRGTLTTYERTLLNRIMVFLENHLQGDEEAQPVGEANNLLDEIVRHLANSI